MEQEIKLNDIADDLLILNKITIDKLFQLDNCVDCIALYIFYYKTAKWQKTNMVKVNDYYIKKSLKWGLDKIRKTKNTLKENGLIDVVQRRNKEGKIEGWYVKLSYIITKRKLEDAKVIIESNQITQKPQVDNSTSGTEDINALKEYIKCLKKEILTLRGGEENNLSKIPYKEIIDYLNECGIRENLGNKVFSFKSDTAKTKKMINARFKEGFTIDDFKDVIFSKYRDWVVEPYTFKNGVMSDTYYRPNTLFSGDNFESYLQSYKSEK